MTDKPGCPCTICEADYARSLERNLRTRIAAVLYVRAMSRLAWHRAWDDLQPDVQQMWLDDADAVIRELDSHGWLIDPDSQRRAAR